MTLFSVKERRKGAGEDVVPENYTQADLYFAFIYQAVTNLHGQDQRCC